LPNVAHREERMLYGNDADRVEVAINEKLRVYKQPIIVALDLAGVLYSFGDVIDAFYGERKIIVPIHMGGAEPPEEARLGPMEEGMLVGRDRNAKRARERLIALLPFEWGLSASNEGERFEVIARVLANPASDPPRALEEFHPIPRFIVSELQGADTAMMRWEPSADPSRWRHVS